MPIRAIGCGFRGCEEVFYGRAQKGKPGNVIFDAKQHLTKHMQDGKLPHDWDYSTSIRNLLRQPDVSEIWQDVIRSGGHDGLCWTECRWQQSNPDLMRYRLERRLFGGDLRDFLVMTYLSAEYDGWFTGLIDDGLDVNLSAAPHTESNLQLREDVKQ